MLPATATRVHDHTPPPINDRIRRKGEDDAALYAAAGPAAIDARLAELDREWDMERTLQTNFATLTLISVALIPFAGRRWALFPAAVAGFMLEHSLQGWCPPVSVFRRLGFRTAAEIDRERHALKALRGDFRELPGESTDRADAGRAFRAAER